MSITTKNDFDRASSTLCGRMVSLDAKTRKTAAAEATDLLAELPLFLKNSPHIKSEVVALKTLISSVAAE